MAPTLPYRSGEVVGADESDDPAAGDDGSGELARGRGPVEQGRQRSYFDAAFHQWRVAPGTRGLT